MADAPEVRGDPKITIRWWTPGPDRKLLREEPVEPGAGHPGRFLIAAPDLPAGTVGEVVMAWDDSSVQVHPTTIDVLPVLTIEQEAFEQVRTEPRRSASIGCPLCGSYGHLAEHHASGSLTSEPGTPTGGWTRSTPLLLSALGALKREVSRAEDAVQTGKAVPPALSQAVDRVAVLARTVERERQELT